MKLGHKQKGILKLMEDGCFINSIFDYTDCSTVNVLQDDDNNYHSNITNKELQALINKGLFNEHYINKSINIDIREYRLKTPTVN